MKKVVVKIGSSLIAPAGKLDSKLINNLVRDVIKAEGLGCKIIIVSSGAIALGANKLGFKKRPQDVHSLMALASIGQIALMDIYTRTFLKYKKTCAQILLSWDDFDKRARFLNARQTIDKLLAMNVVPIINENDAVTDDEIKFGDNDRLSALAADLVNADSLIILSDVKGLMNEHGEVIKVVSKVDDKIYSLVKSKKGEFTAGGMTTKLDAAKIVTSSGINMVIASGREKSIISQVVADSHSGTTFIACQNVNKAKKRWIAFSKKSQGKIYVDDGAKEAILNRGKSLLCVGIMKTEGNFKQKDRVQIIDKEDNVLGCGLVNYSSEELVDWRNKKFSKEIIHRDNFVKNI